MSKSNVNFLRYGVIFLAVGMLGRGVAETLGDPTQPPNTTSLSPGQRTAKPLPRWSLTATFIASDRRVATINGKRVTVGEQIGGATVLAIEPSWVSLQAPNSRKTLTVQLLPKEFKRMVQREADEN